jgi:hypothetical protein
MAASLATSSDQNEHVQAHALIKEHQDLKIPLQTALSRLQAKFRGGRDRETHISRAKLGIPVCPFLRTPSNAVAAMIDMANINAGDVVWDLGCGDGAISLEV